MNKREKSTFPKRVRGGSPSPGNCGLTLAHQNPTQTRPRSGHSTGHTMDVEQPRLPTLENRGRRSIMADQATNQEGRMDERSGRSSGVSEGARGNTSGGMSGSSGTISGSRGDGADIRSSGTVSRKTPRGFAAMDPQAQRAIAAKGGRAAHQKGTAHEFTSEEARIAGRKGGEASRGGRRSSGSSDTNS